ncbi:hypothetical protein [Streptomyces sp. NPDC088115]|uniref:hypothetical protein n=1 Tax=Streptomyces sp. NPDC088115 TaxID=3365824 RepID=UPI0037FDB6AC
MPRLVAPAMPAGAPAATGRPTLPVATEAVLRPWLLTDAEAVREAFRGPAVQHRHVQGGSAELAYRAAPSACCHGRCSRRRWVWAPMGGGAGAGPAATAAG